MSAMGMEEEAPPMERIVMSREVSERLKPSMVEPSLRVTR
jgi:hypothetical protein